jgi:hypothetical protein
MVAIVLSAVFAKHSLKSILISKNKIKIMKKIFHNEKMQKVLKYAAWKMFGTLVVVCTAGGAIWAIAAFTEPTSGPADSVQDFAKNIMGANNADNGFDSSAVVANNNGSIVERLEYLESRDDNAYSSCYTTCASLSVSGWSSYAPACLTGWTSTTGYSTYTLDSSYFTYANCRICCLPR